METRCFKKKMPLLGNHLPCSFETRSLHRTGGTLNSSVKHLPLHQPLKKKKKKVAGAGIEPRFSGLHAKDFELSPQSENCSFLICISSLTAF